MPVLCFSSIRRIFIPCQVPRKLTKLSVSKLPDIHPNPYLEKKAAEAKRILTKYPDRIPVIVEKASRSTLPEIDKKKFLVPGSMLCGEFKYIIHKHLTQQLAGTSDALSAEQTLYLFVRNTPPRTGMFLVTLICTLRLIGALMSELYEAFKDPDGFLYMVYSAENTLGEPFSTPINA
jgi:GABA(A) receptor-associated protein